MKTIITWINRKIDTNLINRILSQAILGVFMLVIFAIWLIWWMNIWYNFCYGKYSYPIKVYQLKKDINERIVELNRLQEYNKSLNK